MSKTIKIARLIEKVNTRNQRSTCLPEVRQGWNSLLEDVLLGAGVYAGFNLLTAAEVPPGQEPGIRGEGLNFTFHDESRRRYAIHHRLWSESIFQIWGWNARRHSVNCPSRLDSPRTDSARPGRFITTYQLPRQTDPSITAA